MHRWLIGIGFIALTLTLVVQPSSGIFLQRFFVGQFGSATLPPEAELSLQIASLKSELAQSVTAEREAGGKPADAVAAFVYSCYPFNFKNEFTITAGKDRGIVAGRAVIALGIRSGTKPVILGKVIAVYDTSSLVRTVFDPSFQISVRIGSGAADALFVGGPEPRLTLIPKKADVKDGDIIYSASDGLPYGLPLGNVATIDLAANKIFKESNIVFPYDMNSIVMVGVLDR